MNKEILKAIEDKQKEHPFRDWWNNNDSLKARRIIFFPIWIYVVISDKIKKWNYDRTTWDEKELMRFLLITSPEQAIGILMIKPFSFMIMEWDGI